MEAVLKVDGMRYGGGWVILMPTTYRNGPATLATSGAVTPERLLLMCDDSTPSPSPDSIPPRPPSLTPVQWRKAIDAIINDPILNRMPYRTYRKKYKAAMLGGDNEFTRHLQVDTTRLPANQWIPLREQIFERDDYTCQYCGERGVRLECDHIIPVSRGGSHDPSNLATACFTCNRSKRDKLLEEWR